jgi:thioredoxin-like negative regulator of GroEL
MGVREAKMLIAYHTMLGDDIAYAKARQILSDNLKADPYHAQSMIMYARLQVAQGHRAEAIQTLQLAQNHVRTQRDQQLIVVEALRQLAAPKIIAELDDIEKQLGLVRSDSETGKPLILPPNFSEDIDARLKAIAGQIQQAQ